MALVVAVVGMPGCGKGELAAVVSAAGLPVFSNSYFLQIRFLYQ